MKMLMVICPEGREAEIRELIAKHDVHAYSELTPVTGEGKTGKKFGTHVFPERSALIFTVIAAAKMGELVVALKEFRSTLYPDEGIKAFVLPVESVL
jgi:hypothetical protein